MKTEPQQLVGRWRRLRHLFLCTWIYRERPVRDLPGQVDRIRTCTQCGRRQVFVAVPSTPSPHYAWVTEESVSAADKAAIVAHFNRITGVTTPLEVDIIEEAIARGFTTWETLREEMRLDIEAGR